MCKNRNKSKNKSNEAENISHAAPDQGQNKIKPAENKATTIQKPIIIP